jgi:hypothetical protein
MGREFMTQIKAVKKVGGSLPSATKQFCTASWLAGHSGIFDTNSLRGYETKDFVSEMHIKPAIVTTKYEITIPEVRVSFGFESGTPQGFTHLSNSDQLSQTKAVLCAVPVDGGQISSSVYTPTNGGRDDNYGVQYMLFSGMKISVVAGTSLAKLYIILYNDQNTMVQYNGMSITNLMSGNNIYRLANAIMRNITAYNNSFNGANYTKTQGVSDSNGAVVNSVWCIMLPLIDDGKSNGDYSVGANMDAIPTNVNSNQELYSFKGSIIYNRLNSFTPTT